MDNSVQYDGFIFTHIHKCAGTSFRSYINDAALRNGVPKEQIYIPGENGLGVRKNIDQLSENELVHFRSRNHKVIAMHAYYGIHKTENLNMRHPFYYTILRDPVRRYLSHYHFFNYTLGGNGCKGKLLDDLDPDFADALIEGNGNLMCKLISNTPPQSKISPQAMLHGAKANLENAFHAFGIMERMETSLSVLKLKAPSWLRFDADFPKLNSSSSQLASPSDRILSLIKKYNAQDIELYSWASELFNDRAVAEV